VALSRSELDLVNRHKIDLDASSVEDELLLRYYQGQQRVRQLGMAIPPDMRRFLVIANWCRVVVDTINNRQQVRSLILPGEETADPMLRAIWDANDMQAQIGMFNRDRMIYGRAFMSVGTNEDDRDLPLVRVESPREMTAKVDVRKQKMTSAARFFGTLETPGAPVTEEPLLSNSNPQQVTLYLPNETIWAKRDANTSDWVEVDRDRHNLGAVPVVMHLNRRMSGAWVGESQLTDIIPFADAAARSLTNMQFAQEAHGIPRMWMTGVAKGDFIDEAGQPIPQFEAYFDAIHTLSKADAKIGQLSAADLKNFETAMNVYGTQAAVTTGFPGRYFGLRASEPPAEGAIRADETTLNRSIESQNEEVGMTLGWVGALTLRFRTGDWVQGGRVRADWFDPATPTVSQREDALAKRRAAGVLSREGYWDELGWSEARKAKERAYFAAEDLDPIARQILRDVNPSADVGA
jgi:hypothetical protein